MEFAVSRDGRALVTLHEGSDTTARDEARATFVDALEALEADGPIVEWEITHVEIHELPTAPFEPYTVELAFVATVVVEADSADRAVNAGATTIDEALAAADVGTISYTSAPTASAG
ncbi:hypothetical protein [Natrialba sp. INN-245]|uniref:hypothetical protein n=1 Tax=Natrialba sp. INN-245 TaxID=2690967 RepID=UPI00131341B4|nr:hypothetical protein [Natrialba sp. INN-245]MWV38599.1 hypothetical protein [Natrialba sp. INN-245]